MRGRAPRRSTLATGQSASSGRSRGANRLWLQPLTAALAAAGVRGWAAFTWLTQPSTYLSGAVPSEVARTEPVRALRAAHRFAGAAVQPPGTAPLPGRPAVAARDA